MEGKNRKKRMWLVWSMTIALVLLFFFGYVLNPLFEKVIHWFSPARQAAVAHNVMIDHSRKITVQFAAVSNNKLPWVFRPETRKIELHPGQDIKIYYYAKNQSNKQISVQAVPSVLPEKASAYLRKIECFCFNQQTLASSESMYMPMLFHLDTKIPKNIHKIVLSYSLVQTKSSK